MNGAEFRLGKAWKYSGDVDPLEYGGAFFRKVADGRFHVIRILNLWEATGEETGARYHVDLYEADTTCAQVADALRSCGLDLEQLPADAREWAIADALVSYGAAAPLWDDAGNNVHALVREARRESRTLATNADAYESAMERPVNAIGSTAREYAQGDFRSAIDRGLERGDPAAEILAKMD